jgi:hypothetical protein
VRCALCRVFGPGLNSPGRSKSRSNRASPAPKKLEMRTGMPYYTIWNGDP